VRSDEGGIAADNSAPEHVTVTDDSVQRVLFLPLPTVLLYPALSN
jgi:hypothetical protein